MKILLVGNRAIQYGLAARLQHEGHQVLISPGQSTGQFACLPQAELSGRTFDLVVNGSARYFGNEAVLALKDRGVPYFGPSQRAGQLETSKAFFDAFCHEHAIRRPASATITHLDELAAWTEAHAPPYVLKENGPAGGCGVHILQTPEEAFSQVRISLAGPHVDGQPPCLIAEEFIDGFEVGVNVFVDGCAHVILPPTHPHKRRYGRHEGPLVAGMGSVAPVLLNAAFEDELSAHVIKPILAGFRALNETFTGCLFLNLMLRNNEIFVLECNMRMGDPAMLVDLLLLKSPLGDALLATARQELAGVPLHFKSQFAAAVTLVTPEYPQAHQERQMQLAPQALWDGCAASGVVLSSASYRAPALISTGGVVAVAVARGATPVQAVHTAYDLAAQLPELETRPDIGQELNPPAPFAVSAVQR